MSDTDYDALIEGGALDPASSAKSSLNVGSWSNPDEEARLQSLAKKSGVPVEALRETAPEVEKKLQVDSVDYDALFEQSPTVGSWLSDVRNAQIAHDDVQNLSKIERAWHLTKDAWTSFRFSPIGQMGGQGMQGMAAMGKAAGRTVARATGTTDEFALLDRAFGDYDEKVLGFLFPQERIGRSIEQFAKDQNIPEERQNFVTDTAGAVGGVVGQILLPGAGTALMAAAESEQLERRAEKAGTAGTAGADAAILLGGVASYGLEKLGLDAILRRLPPKLRNKALRHGSDLLLAGGGEGVTEGLQSAASDVLTKTLIDEEHQMFESVGYEAGVGFTTGAIVRGVLNTIAPGRLQFSEDAQKAAQAIQTGDRLENLVKEIQAAKLPTRSPEAFEDLVSRMTAQGNEEVGVPIEVLRTYAQSQNYAPEALVAELTGGTGAYVEAAMTGGDVRIPTGKFLASKHAPALVRDTRLRPESLTSNEAQQWGDNDANGELKTLMSTLKAQSEENGPAIQSAKKIYDDIYNQAIGAGVQDTLAAVVARTQQARYLARAQRLSAGAGKEIDPYDLFKQEVLRIGNEPAPEGVTYESRGGAMDFLQQKFNDPLVESYVAMLDPEESFLYNRTTAEDLDEIVETVLGGAGINASVEEMGSAKSRGIQKLFVIDTKQEAKEGDLWERADRSTTVTLTNKNEVFINISDNEPGTNGSAIYQAVANWAYNNGYKFIEDPSGLSEKSIWRRPENMLSSVLRFGDSRHVDSGLMMALPGMKGQGDATPIQFTGKQGEDARQLIEATARNVRTKLPDVATMSYDFESGTFTKGDGTTMTDEDIRSMVQQQGDDVLFGPSSIKRAIISQSLMAKEKELGPDGLRKLASKSAKGKSLPKVFYQKPDAANHPRGQVQFGSQGERIITLFAQANESTLLHELGHTWLEELHADANGDSATEQLKQDWATVEKWFKDSGHPIPDNGAIPVEAHELWARGIERYFMEGKSPSKELNSVFFLFRRWLLRIYQAVSALRTPINKDIRAVFDRLIATDEAIAQSRLKIARRATFAKAADMGVSEEVFAAYERAQHEAAEFEQSSAEQEALSEVITQHEEEYRNALADNRERLRKEYEQKPEYRAIKWLRTGELPDGSAIPDVAHARLDAAAVKRMYPNDELFVQRVRRAGLYSLQGGLDPEMVAPLFGYDSADQMLRALVAAPRMMQAVRDEAERITRLEFGDSLLDVERRMNIAMEAVHSDNAGRLLRAELLALRKLQRDSAPLRKQAKAEQKAKDDAKIQDLKSDNLALRAALSSEKKERAYERRWMDAERNTEESDARQMLSQIPTVKQMRDTARQIIANSTVRSISREEILRNERAASRKSFEAAAKKDYHEAFTAKVQQLLNHYLYLEASRALEQVAKTQRFAKSLTTIKAQERLGKAGSDYQEQINSLLEQYEFKAASGKQVARRASLLEWVEKQRADGNEVLISPELLVDARKINFKDLTFGELSDLHEALQNINRLASLKNKLLKGRAKVEYEATIAELLQELRESLTTDRPPPDDRNTINLLGRIGEGFQEFDATLLKAEQVFRWFSKDDPNGVWMQTIFEPIANAQSAEMDLQKDFTVKLTQLFDNFYKDRGRGVLMEQQLVPLLNQNYTLNAALAAALNTGNEANREKLLKGRNWSEAQLEQLLSRLTKQDWDFVQSVWDLMSELWPQVSALQSRLTGVAPPKVEATPVNTPFGVYSGGYYPLVGDSRVSEIGEKQEFDAGNKLYEPGHVKATTSQGHTKSRTKAIYPLLLDISIVPQHMSQVIHDLTHREAILNASKILSDSRIRAEITNRMGLPYYKGLRAWLKSVANSSNVDQNGSAWWNKFLSYLRMNANIVAMGFKVTTTFANLGGYVQAIEQVSPQRMAWAMKHFYKNPMRAIREVQAKSGEMRNRSNSIERDIFENYNKNLGKSGPLTWVHRHAFIGIAFVDSMISTPTWMGAYADAVQKGKTEEEAVAYADSIVRTTQSAGGIKDLAAVQRGNEVIKFLTMFYSYFNMVYNRLRSLGKTPKVGAAKFAQVAWRSTLLVVVPPLLNEFLAGRGIPDDEEDEPYWWAAKKVALYPMMTVPLLRDVAGTLDSGFESRTPVGAFGKALADLVRKSIDVAQGERDPEELAKPAMSAAGYAFGLPAGQINITGGYLWDLAVGEEVPESAAEVTKNLMFRREE